MFNARDTDSIKVHLVEIGEGLGKALNDITLNQHIDYNQFKACSPEHAQVNGFNIYEWLQEDTEGWTKFYTIIEEKSIDNIVGLRRNWQVAFKDPNRAMLFKLSFDLFL